MKIKIQVFFYDGADYKTGVMMTGEEAYRENYIEFTEDGSLVPTDECSIIRLYTGLKDKNNKEIYEGDINSNNDVVVWCDECNSFQWHWNLDGEHICHACDGDFQFVEYVDEVEIMGNIYENPELI